MNETPKPVQVALWFGKPVDQLNRDRLLEMVKYCGDEIKRLREDRDRWAKAGDISKYLRGC